MCNTHTSPFPSEEAEVEEEERRQRERRGGNTKRAARIQPGRREESGRLPTRGRETSHIHSPLFGSQVLSVPITLLGARPIGLSKKEMRIR